MPIYEYECSKCGKVFEAMQKVTDKPLARCKYCNGKVERLISNTSFQLKGSGWYVTDYARKPAADSGESGDKSAAKGDKKTTEAPETKPAKKEKTPSKD